MTTVWGDDGTECNIYTSLPGLQIYAEMNYEGNTDRIDEMFKACTGYELNKFLMMGIDNFDKELCPTMEAGTSKQVFYQDILQGMIDKNLAEFDFKSYYCEYREKFKDISGEGKFKYLFDYYKVLFDILYVKCDLGINLTRAYKENNLEEMKNLISDMDILVEKYLEIHKLAKDMWYNTNKPFGFEVLDFRFGGMQARIKTAKERVMQYINGDLVSIPELEEERLWYSGFKTAFPRGLKGWTSTEVLTPSPIKGA